jgi:cytoskeletal protein CcmA (bactofilin family)
MIFAFFLMAFLSLLVLPFLPGIIELRKSHDSRALPINMEYSRDPRYFGRSFKGLLKRALQTKGLDEGKQQITLSKKETVEILPRTKIPAGNCIDHLMVVHGNFVSLEKVRLNKEIYVEGKASIGERNTLRALASEGKVSLAFKTRVIRWVDAEGVFTADHSCDLGWSISSGSRIKIGADCRFRRLFGMPIQTWHENPVKESSDVDQGYEDIGDSAIISDRDWTVIPPSTKIDKTLIFKQNLRIKNNCVLNGDIKTYKKLVLEEGVRIRGNVFAENGIRTGPRARIFGNIFSQESISIGKESKVGRAGAIKSVVARKEIALDRGVVIYGYIVAGKRGRVL